MLDSVYDRKPVKPTSVVDDSGIVPALASVVPGWTRTCGGPQHSLRKAPGAVFFNYQVLVRCPSALAVTRRQE